MAQQSPQGMKQMQRAVMDALECHRVCEETIGHCLQAGGRYAEASHIRLLTDCADVCRMTADMMARSSEFHPQMCGMCADVCVRCAEDCERFSDDEQMRRCAEACRRCAESCRQMAGVA
ncbi:hypothetical protein C3Y87_17830 [Carbonactinospora thermoautotrophica]|uniref:four-helix bundle copper-binding protein n=1 Tax=Carbonactinospora thermoautotrophica TaxID=1469144 RepID=UPI00227164FB|nr:four-helix bundle copper-binding protein [Carbonactinospora thermoautotrophica]MCX9193226.1 hypothetical protein [Carbonactinospora thermoautotrophica]